MIKQSTFLLLKTLFEQSKGYLNDRLELLKLKTIDRTSRILSLIIVFAILFIVFFIFFVILNIGIALLIGDLLGKAYLGFLIWAAVYALIGFIIISKRTKLVKGPITSLFIRKFL